MRIWAVQIFIFWAFFSLKIRKVQFFKVPFRGNCLEIYISQDADVQFIRELFLRVGDVHIWLVVHGNHLFGLSWPPFERPKNTQFLPFSNCSIFLASRRIRTLMIWADKVMKVLCWSWPMILNDPLVVTQFIETMELLRVQGPNNNI
jgi:hypothetical protein